MAKAKTPAKSKMTKSKPAPKKAAVKKASGKATKAAASVVRTPAPKKSPAPAMEKAAAVAKPASSPAAPKTAPRPAAPENTSGAALSWSDSLRKAMQEKNAQRHWPENKTEWKDRQRAGLSITHRNKFG